MLASSWTHIIITLTNAIAFNSNVDIGATVALLLLSELKQMDSDCFLDNFYWLILISKNSE